MLKTWNEYSNSHFVNCDCLRRIAKTLWALTVCAGFGAICGVVCGAAVGFVLGIGFGTYGLFVGVPFGAVLGAIAGFFAGLIGAVLSDFSGWFFGGFLGGGLVGLWFFPFTGAMGAFAATFLYEKVLQKSKNNLFCYWILETVNNSDLGQSRTRKLWIAPVFVLYLTAIFFLLRYLQT
jgi:hypothetical protein